MDKYIKQEDAVKALWKALYDYEDKTEKQFQESEDLELKDWYSHRIFVQRMSGEDLQAIINLPSADVVSREDYEGLELVCKNYEEALKDAVDELEKSDRKRGKIITNEFGNESCSVCHYGLVLFITDENNTLKKPNFCPNCGADMRGEKDV